MNSKTRAMQRRLVFSLLILVSQLLLIGLAISWVVHMVIIAIWGAVYFIECNPFFLWSEIIVSVLITAFAVCLFVIQIRRLRERREIDRNKDENGIDR
jgi:hypothetical protein